MIKYFVVKIWLFDEEGFHTEDSIKRKLEDVLDAFQRDGKGLLWEVVKAKVVDQEEYEKED